MIWRCCSGRYVTTTWAESNDSTRYVLSTTSPTCTTNSASPLAMKAAGLADFSSSRPTNRNGTGGGGGTTTVATVVVGAAAGATGASQPRAANGSLAAACSILPRVGSPGAAAAPGAAGSTLARGAAGVESSARAVDGTTVSLSEGAK